MKKITILGSTGSIGTQTLEVVDALGDITVTGLSVYQNTDLLEKQIQKYNPCVVAVADENAAKAFAPTARALGTTLLSGLAGVSQLAAMDDTDMVVTALVGISGLRPTLSAIDAGHDLALANKETLVAGGKLVMQRAKEKGVRIVPVDSEHGAIFQCLTGEDWRSFDKILLTASGGPFRTWPLEKLYLATKKDALNHPNWAMGDKITVDSATMMNKGLEVIEAKWLFGSDAIEVLVHPQSIIHSMVSFVDGAVIAQMGKPDMRIPISYALAYPVRMPTPFPKIDFLKQSALTFEAPDTKRFPCLRLAYQALKMGGTAPCILNGANEKAVALFLQDAITFMQIPELVERALNECAVLIKEDYTLTDIETAHEAAMRSVVNNLNSL